MGFGFLFETNIYQLRKIKKIITTVLYQLSQGALRRVYKFCCRQR